MKIYLLNPPFLPNFGRSARWQDTSRGGTLYYPIWLSYATALLEKNHKVKLTDAPAWKWETKRVIENLKNFGPDLVILDSSFPSLRNDISIAEKIKEEYETKVVLVGPPTSCFADKILSNNIDFVARFEYDFTLSELADSLEDNKPIEKIKGLSYKFQGKIIHNPNREFSRSEDLDEIPFVSMVYKKHLDIKDYFLGQSLYPEVQIFTGRGCPNQCTFCSWPQTLMGRKYRVRKISSVIDELAWIHDNLDIKEVFFEDDTFTISKRRVLNFCKEYKEKDLNITWSCNARVDTLDLAVMKEMEKCNCRSLIVGFESGSDKILNNIKKGIDTKSILEFSKMVKKTRLIIHGDFIIGLPGESKESITMTKNIIKKIKPDILQVSVASPFPGTEFYSWCIEKGLISENDLDDYLDSQGHQRAIINYPNLTDIEIAKEVDDILKDYYFSINYIPRAFNQVFRRTFMDETKRLFYSMKMFLKYINQRN